MLFSYDKLKAFQEVNGLLEQSESLLFENLWNSPKALIAALAAKKTNKHILIITGASVEETRLFQDLAALIDCPLVDFPAWETLPSESIAPSPDIVGDRYAALDQMQVAPCIVISNLQACLQKLLAPSIFKKLHYQVKVGSSPGFQKTIDQFKEMGYQKVSIVSDKGQFATRGGIIDIFPVSSPDPYRLEFFDDELESLRTFDPIGQKSIQSKDSLEILPGQELELMQKEKNFYSLLDYLGKNTLIIFDDLLALEDRYVTLKEVAGCSPYFFSIEDFFEKIEPYQKIYFAKESIDELSEVQTPSKLQKSYYASTSLPIEFELFNRSLSATRLSQVFKELDDEDLLKSLENPKYKDFDLYFIADTEAEELKLQKQIHDLALHLPKNTQFLRGYLSSGFILEGEKLIVLPITELTHRYKIRRQKQRSTYHSVAVEVNDLQPGDLVVHFNHGIGKFLGVEKKPNNQGVLSEYFLVEYAESGKLYVQVQQAYLLSKYIGAHDEIPRLHTIGGTRWKATKEKTQAAILGYAKELLDLYAHREMKGGFTFGQDSPDLIEFEEDFAFKETEDQLAAITDIKNDMVQNKAMDRLVCGDVGYGKTEVAMRAAFKAVVDGGKQVAVLVPTTVLAMQHFESFSERMSNFPVRIGVLSRFQTPKENRKTLKELEEGALDIIVGTHRLVSEDVIFKDLGLVIIDEEQRFGVKAKEHLKKIKAGVDCLTLTATPIPRTLYMSLVGARDMSVISSPPQDRLPIKTIIAEPDPITVKNALIRELTRDGQVYYIYNRVETILDAAAKLKELVPKARIVVAHGQMDPDELDLVFHAFKSGKADILVATTIVENGIDIPNANTILIDRSDRFGLADLYQLRGRVGRWNRRAYAYFLVPRLRSLPELSRKRLDALAESSGYGGGMKLAMRDLEIRGAGDILGIEQSGHVASVGFHLYCKMLKKTIKALQGNHPKRLTDVKIEIPVDARIPDNYIEDISLRMELYQRLGESTSKEEVDALQSEMNDRFGKLPEPALWLIQLAHLKIIAEAKGYTLIKAEKLKLTLEKLKGRETVRQSILISPLKNPVDIHLKITSVL